MDTALLARGEILPLVVLGYQVAGADHWRKLATTRPIYLFDHQFGGYACLHDLVVGVGLRLVDNLERATRDPRGLIDALCSMGEFGEPRFGARYPEADQLLDGWYETHGDELTEPDVRVAPTFQVATCSRSTPHPVRSRRAGALRVAAPGAPRGGPHGIMCLRGHAGC